MNTKTTLFLLLAAVVAAGVLFLTVQPWKAPETAKEPEPAAKPLFEKKPEGIDRVEVVLRDGGKRAFAKEGDDWALTEPLQAPANRYEVDQIVNTIGDLKYTRSFGKNDKDRPKETTTGLDKPLAVVRLFKAGKTEAEVTVGSRAPTGTGNFFRLAGSDDVRQSENDLTSIFNKRLDSYRNRQVMQFDMKDVRRVTVEGQQNYTLVKTGDNWVIESPVRARADKDKAEGLVRPMTSLYIQEWQSDNPTSYALYQLEQPRLKVTVETERTVPAKYAAKDPAATRPADTQPSTETRTYTLLVGGMTGTASNNYFAKTGSAPWVFSLSEHSVKEMSVPLADLQDKALAKVEQAKVKKVTVQAGGESAVLSKSDKGEWTFADGTRADPAAVGDLIKAVADLRANSFADPKMPLPAEDWSRPRAKVSLTVEGQVEPVSLLVGGATPSGRMVYVRNEAEEPIAAVSEELVAPLLLPPVSYRDRLVMTVPRERLNRIEITRAKAPAVSLERKEGKWSMKAPIEAPADADAVRNVVNDVANLLSKRVAGVGRKADFGLDKPEVTLALWIDRVSELPGAKVVGPGTQPAGTQPAVATRPSAATHPTATRPAGTQPAADSTALEAANLKRRIDSLESLLQYNRDHPDQAKPEVTELLQKDLAEKRAQYAALTGQSLPPATAPASAPAIGQIVVAASQPSAPATQPATATTQPAGPEIRRLHLARKDGKTYACLDGGDMIWELDDRVREDATAEFHERLIARFEVANVTDVAFDHGAVMVGLRRSGEEWRYVTDPLVQIDKQKVTDVLNVFRELKTHRYVDYAAADLARYGFNEEPDSVSIGLNNGQNVVILLSPRGPENDPDKSRYARLSESNKVFLLKEDQARKFAQKLEDFVKSDKPAGGTASVSPSSLGDR